MLLQLLYQSWARDHNNNTLGRKMILGRGAAITMGGGQLFKAIIIIKRPTKY